MLMDVGAPVRVGPDLGSKAIDIPELRRRRMSVEQIVDASRGSPPATKGIVSVEIQLAEAFAIDLAGERRGAGAAGRCAGKVLRSGGIDAWAGRERIAAEVPIVETGAPAPEVRQGQGQRAGRHRRIADVFAPGSGC